MPWPYAKDYWPKNPPKDISCVLCLDCGTLLASVSGHDYRTCDCPNFAMIDGGNNYLRCGAMNLDRIVAGRMNLKTWKFKEFKNGST
jgi:hypothetical protein